MIFLDPQSEGPMYWALSVRNAIENRKLENRSKDFLNFLHNYREQYYKKTDENKLQSWIIRDLIFYRRQLQHTYCYMWVEATSDRH